MSDLTFNQKLEKQERLQRELIELEAEIADEAEKAMLESVTVELTLSRGKWWRLSEILLKNNEVILLAQLREKIPGLKGLEHD